MSAKEHYIKYRDMAKKHGIGYSGKGKFMGKTKEQWEKYYVKDKHLNSYPLRHWDAMHDPYMRVTLCETVCMYKHVVIHQVIGKETNYG